MGVFRTKFVTENVEQCRAMSRNGRERGRGSKHYLTCQIWILWMKFWILFCCVSSVPDFLHDGSRQFRIFRFPQWTRLYRAQIAQFFRFSKTQLKGTQGYIRLEALLHQHPRLMANMLRHRNSNETSSNRLHHIHPKMPACGAENKIGNFTQLSLDTKKYRTRGT